MSRLEAYSQDYLTLDEVHPVVDLAAYYNAKEPMWHRYRIPCAHFLLIKAGEIEAVAPEGRFIAKPRDMLSFGATDLNQYGTHGPVEFYEAHIQLARPPRHRLPLLMDGIGRIPVLLSLGELFEPMRDLFDTLCIDLPHPNAERRARVNAAVWEMLAILASVAQKSPERARHVDPWQRARGRLSSDFSERVQIRTLAKELGLSEDHFIRRFKQRFGVSPNAWRVQARLHHAAQRLRSSDSSVKSLAFELGFEDAYSFTRAFKRHFGVLPSDIRSGRTMVASVEGVAADALLKPNQHVLPPDVVKDASFYQKFTP